MRRLTWPGVLVAAGLIGTPVLIVHGATENQTTRQQLTAAESTAQQVAQPLARICSTDRAAANAAGADCPQAIAIARGEKGDTGAPGRGITSTAIDGAGHLIVTFNDGTRSDAGKVVGADGRGIASTVLESGRLVLVLTDGTRTDLGQIVGPAGRGIASVSTAGGRLTVTLDDGTSLDAGPLPQGPAGVDGQTGAAGPACPAGFEPVETTEATGSDGTRYSRSITCVDPASAQPQQGNR